jgi:ribonuclease G
MKQILITSRPWEKRIAIMQNNLLQNIYFDSKSTCQLERSFFKGKVAKVLPGVQTSFVDIGQPKAGFLHISEIDRDLAFKRMGHFEEEELEEESRQGNSNNNNKSRSSSKSVDISQILKQGEDILIQVNKEPINEKGAKLTTCFTLPGRLIVLMPNIPKIGISKKIVNFEERKRLKDLVLSVLPDHAGCIIRTTCEERPDSEIIQDIRYLLDVWDTIQKKFAVAKSEECIYRDIDLTLQIIRDCLDENVEKIICDDEETFNKITYFIKRMAPEYLSRAFLYNDKTPLFELYNIENQIQQALQSKFELNSGGSIVIDSTEAMTVIDVNTARYVGATNLDETILKTNLDAAKEIVRQLKLRNVGGLVVIDFIDMSFAADRNKLFNYFEKTLKEEDKSQSVVLKISEFGLVQMTRKRSGKTLRQSLLNKCEYCCGSGVSKSISTRSYEMMRSLERFIFMNNTHRSTSVVIIADQQLADHILNIEYDSILYCEKKYSIKIVTETNDEIEKGFTFRWA